MIWHVWNKWPLLTITVTAAVLAAPPDEGQGRTQTADTPQQVAPEQPQQSPPLPRQAATQEKQASQAEQQIGHAGLERLKLVRPGVAAEKTDVVNAFNPNSWYVAPPPPPKPPPPKPTAPPVPFTYLGRYEDPPKLVVILSHGDRLYTVSEGEVIENTYRVEHISDVAIDIVYLPMDVNQSISMGQPISMGAK